MFMKYLFARSAKIQNMLRVIYVLLRLFAVVSNSYQWRFVITYK